MKRKRRLGRHLTSHARRALGSGIGRAALVRTHVGFDAIVCNTNTVGLSEQGNRKPYYGLTHDDDSASRKEHSGANRQAPSQLFIPKRRIRRHVIRAFATGDRQNFEVDRFLSDD